jgi:hypothetical protein
MDSYVAVVSQHGKPQSAYIFATEAEARRFAVDLRTREEWQDKSHHHEPGEDHDHDHEGAWLEDWGDADGCGVVVGLAVGP